MPLFKRGFVALLDNNEITVSSFDIADKIKEHNLEKGYELVFRSTKEIEKNIYRSYKYRKHKFCIKSINLNAQLTLNYISTTISDDVAESTYKIESVEYID